MNGYYDKSLEDYYKTETLWNLMLQYLNHNRCCEVCGEKMWVGYWGGHVYDRCLSCPETELFGIKELSDGNYTLEIPGYITHYPVPTEPLPDCIETRPFNGSGWDAHEQYYRMKKNEKES